MIWDDEGYLISKNKYNENSIIAEFFTKEHGKTTGIIFGAASKKIKGYLLIGNYFKLNYNYKNESRSGYFKVEISKINTPYYLENNVKLACLIYSMNLIKLLTVENQSNIKIHKLLDGFFDLLKTDDWIKNFILWELNILKVLGYDLNFKDYALNTDVNGVNKYVVKSNIDRLIPNFLIDKTYDLLNKKDLHTSLKLVGDFLEKTVLRPNNIPFPVTRLKLINLLINL